MATPTQRPEPQALAGAQETTGCCGGHGRGHGHSGGHHAHDAPPAGKTAVDPVCGMQVNPATTPHRASHAGTDHVFCSAGCRSKFVADPQKYLAPRPAAAAPEVPAGTIYTCPMHPQIRQVGPGSCPICGMALEPELVSAEAEPNPELIDMTRRFWIGLALAVPVAALEMGGHVFDLHMLIGQPAHSTTGVASTS